MNNTGKVNNKLNLQELLKNYEDICNRNILIISNSEMNNNSIKKILDCYNSESESLYSVYRKESKFISESFDQVILFIESAYLK